MERGEEKRERAGVSKLNGCGIPVTLSVNKCHAASQADRQSGFVETGAERTTTD